MSQLVWSGIARLAYSQGRENTSRILLAECVYNYARSRGLNGISRILKESKGLLSFEMANRLFMGLSSISCLPVEAG